MTAKTEHPLPQAEDVLRFLEAHPDFLIDHRLAANPSGSLSQRVISLSHEALRRARNAIEDSAAIRQNIAELSAANQTSQARVFQAACLLMAAQSVQDVITAIHDYLPDVLALHGARLVVTKTSPLAADEGVITCSDAEIRKLINADKTGNGKTDYILGRPDTLQQQIFKDILPPQTVSTALARLPALPPHDGSTAQPENDAAMILVLVGLDEQAFTPGHGTELLAFTVTLIAIALQARGSHL